MRRAILVNTSSAYLTLEEVVEETGAREELIAELENFGIVQPEKRDGKTVYDETDREIVRSANELSRVGVGGPQPARLPLLRRPRGEPAGSAARARRCARATPSAARRRCESLESLAATVSHLKHLLLVRDLRRLAGD